jgi:hypothetical protein
VLLRSGRRVLQREQPKGAAVLCLRGHNNLLVAKIIAEDCENETLKRRGQG